MNKVVLAVLAFLAAPVAASAQYVKDFVEVEGARANKLRAYGLVTGLNGNGDSPKGESARLLRNMLQNLVNPEAIVQEINARNAALVLVTAELAPFQKVGTRLDVSVSAVGDARSLYGGELQLTDLRGPLGQRDPVIYALASGRLVAQGDPRRGNPTTGTVPAGAIVEKELVHNFVTDIRVSIKTEDKETSLRRKGFKLVLKKPDPTTASQLAFQINAVAVTGSGGKLGVVTVIDGGSMLVRIPTREEYKEVTGSWPEVDYELEPVRWLDVILNKPVTFFATEHATVVINDATKTVSFTGEVKLREGNVMLAVTGSGPMVFTAKDGDRLKDFLGTLKGAVTDQQMIDVVKALHASGLIKADVRSQ